MSGLEGFVGSEGLLATVAAAAIAAAFGAGSVLFAGTGDIHR